MTKRIIVILAATLVLLAGYLVLWPVPIDPVAWNPPPAPELVGPLAPNDALSKGHRILEGIGLGPEDVAIDAEGRLYTGFEEGLIVRTPAGADEPELFADTGGRPLGMVFDSSHNLVVADAVLGLLAISPDGLFSPLATSLSGEPFGFLDDLDIAPDGVIYVTDASSKFGYGSDIADLMEHGGHGRLLAFDPSDRSLRVLLEGLQFANGVAAARDGTFVLVAETGSYRILKYWLAGEHAGTSEVFVDNLPGFPDNINLTEDGRLWVALPSPRVPAVDRMAPRPFLRKLAMRLPKALQPAPLRHGIVLEVDPGGRILRSLQDPSGEVAIITSAMEHEGHLYLGSYTEPWLWQVRLPGGDLI
jgi:sugar lactone lactonase YvrE